MTKKKEQEVPWDELGAEAEGTDRPVVEAGYGGVEGDIEPDGDTGTDSGAGDGADVDQERSTRVYFRVAETVEPEPVLVNKNGLEIDRIVCDVTLIVSEITQAHGLSIRYKSRNVESTLEMRPRNLECVIEIPSVNFQRPDMAIQDIIGEILDAQIQGVEIAVIRATVREDKHKAEVERLNEPGGALKKNPDGVKKLFPAQEAHDL